MSAGNLGGGGPNFFFFGAQIPTVQAVHAYYQKTQTTIHDSQPPPQSKLQKNGVSCSSIVEACAFLQKDVRAARVQNEFAPENFLNRYEKRFEKREKGSEKTIRNAIEKFLAPLRPTKNFSPPIFHQSLKVFHRPKFAQKKSFFFTARLCRGGHAKRMHFPGVLSQESRLLMRW